VGLILVDMATKCWLGAEIQTPTGLSDFLPVVMQVKNNAVTDLIECTMLSGVL